MKDKRFKDLRFNLTNNMMIELLITHQMLEDSLKEDSKMSDEERGLLYYHFEELKKRFYKRVQEKQQERD